MHFFVDIVLIAAALAVAGLVYGVKLDHHDNVKNAPTTPPGGMSTCTTPECVELSSEILSRLDDSFDPCEDFYNFTCNKFDKNAMIPYGKLNHSCSEF